MLDERFARKGMFTKRTGDHHPMKRKPINWFKVRVFFLSCLIFFCFALVIGRMFQLQVLKKEQLYELADHQQHAQIPLVPKRGTISDRKENELAVSIEVDSVYADPKKVMDPGKTAQSLAAVLQTDPGELKGKLKNGSSFEWIQRKITPKEVEEIKALRLPGISFLKENKRFYPNGQLAAHVIGFVGLDSKGLEGLESQYDNQLNGNKHMWYAARDARGREIVENVSSQERSLPEYRSHPG
jgi:cell division protein FtsI (penicillin-binding protein 3)